MSAEDVFLPSVVPLVIGTQSAFSGLQLRGAYMQFRAFHLYGTRTRRSRARAVEVEVAWFPEEPGIVDLRDQRVTWIVAGCAALAIPVLLAVFLVAWLPLPLIAPSAAFHLIGYLYAGRRFTSGGNRFHRGS